MVSSGIERTAPDTGGSVKLLSLLLAAAAVCFGQGKIDTGAINGAEYRIDVPEKWNGTLIMYCHGYSPSPGKATTGEPNAAWKGLLDAGFAMAQSGYAAGGWAIQEAVNDTEALRRHFVKTYGQPKETYVMGHSMGGHLTMVMMETFPNVYDGGLALCGVLGAADDFMLKRVFHPRVVFDYYFPALLPDPSKVPAGYQMTPALNAEVIKTLEAKPEQAAAMRRWSGIKTNKELGQTMVFFTYILKDLQQRGGGNPFDNRSTIYDGSVDDNALNKGVTRYAADARAAMYVRRYTTPTGRIENPMLAIHTTYDPLVPPWVPNDYAVIAARAGREGFFVQQAVAHDGHCAITPAEISRGFDALRKWKQTGERPKGGLVE